MLRRPVPPRPLYPAPVNRRRQLAVGEWAVLALLCERPAHGYAIKDTMAPDGDLGQIWSLSQPLTYRTINVLKSLGLVEVVGVKPGDQAPQRTELRATPEAERMVSRWLETPETRMRNLRSSFMLKLHLLRRRGRSPVGLLTAQRKALAERIDGLVALAGTDGAPDALVLRWRQTTTEAALTFVEETLAAEVARSGASVR